MWTWRAFILSMCIALFAVLSSPARGLEISLHSENKTVHISVYNHNIDNPISVAKLNHTTQILSSDYLLIKRNNRLKEHNNQVGDDFRSEIPPEHIRFNRDIRWPPFERSAYSAFSSSIQNEPIFVLAYEFLPEILGRQHFLAPLTPSVDIPWYLRPDAASNQSKLNGWKDANTLYTGTITYLS
ncbi:hypothetical protein [Aliiglaciecola lipolytica]|uniref:hypothetical protein n=1 Tax=Aliiglaciecola lipolytica TaxID=477689 RepID=UPI001C091412|nr:hypothetical protein [Aliiglaciecola lipolytica]MBU2876864.1 hypothetical protein [Aliiglaciecola lipolytica]